MTLKRILKLFTEFLFLNSKGEKKQVFPPSGSEQVFGEEIPEGSAEYRSCAHLPE